MLEDVMLVMGMEPRVLAGICGSYSRFECQAYCPFALEVLPLCQVEGKMSHQVLGGGGATRPAGT